MIKEIYPDDFTDDMKQQYDLLFRQAKLLFPEAEEWTLKLAITAYIRQGDGERPKISKEEIELYKSKYDIITTEYKTEITDEELNNLEVNEDVCKWIGTTYKDENKLLSLDRNANIQNNQTESVIS